MEDNINSKDKLKGNFPGLKRIAEKQPYKYNEGRRMVKNWHKREILRAIMKGKVTAHIIHNEWTNNRGFPIFRTTSAVHKHLRDLYDIGIIQKLPKKFFKDYQEWTLTEEGKSLFINHIGED